MALAKPFEPDPGQAGVGMELLPPDYRVASLLVFCFYRGAVMSSSGHLRVAHMFSHYFPLHPAISRSWVSHALRVCAAPFCLVVA